MKTQLRTEQETVRWRLLALAATLLLLAIAAAGCGPIQSKGTLKGSIYDGLTPGSNVTISLVSGDASQSTLATAVTNSRGEYAFANRNPGENVTVLFSANANSQLPMASHLSYAWVDVPSVPAGITTVPRLNISNSGLKHVSPAAGYTAYFGTLATNPIRLEWTPYAPQGIPSLQYWVFMWDDYNRDTWQSELTYATSVWYDGQTKTGETGKHYWAIGGYYQDGNYRVSINTVGRLLNLESGYGPAGSASAASPTNMRYGIDLREPGRPVGPSGAR